MTKNRIVKLVDRATEMIFNDELMDKANALRSSTTGGSYISMKSTGQIPP